MECSKLGNDILERYRDELSLVEGEETINNVSDAIYAHPKLGALATNARSAHYLTQAVAQLSKVYKRIAWGLQLDAWVPAIVVRVDENYFDSNAIKNLSESQRRRVATSVFDALKEIKMGDMTIPSFQGLASDKELAISQSLVQYNVEFGMDHLGIRGKTSLLMKILQSLYLLQLP